jgi:hypothetical protein
MIAKLTRSTNLSTHLHDLYRPVGLESHDDPHIAAGWWTPQELEPRQRPQAGRDFTRLISLLMQPIAALGDLNYHKPVWRCVLRAAPQDRRLSDQEWGQAAQMVMAYTGLAPGGDQEAVRWIAVRRAADHLHLVATLARIDGDRPQVWRDARKVRDACAAIEDAFGLRKTGPGTGPAA